MIAWLRRWWGNDAAIDAAFRLGYVRGWQAGVLTSFGRRKNRTDFLIPIGRN